MKICPKCEKEFKSDVNFCPEDGERLIEKTHFQTKNEAHLTGTNKVLAGGDVTQHISHHTENKVFNQDESHKIKTCIVSKRQGIITEGAICKSCNQWALNEYFNFDSGICQKCETQQLQAKDSELRKMVRQFLENDHALDQKEWEILDIKARTLGVSHEQKIAIVEEERRLDTDQGLEKLSPLDKVKINSARDFFENKGDPKKAFNKLEGLCEIYPENRELAELYVLIAVEANPNEGLSLLNNHHSFRHDSAIKAIRKIEIYESLEQDKKADQEERQAIRQFGRDPLVKGKSLERLIDLYYRDKQESIQSEAVTQALADWGWDKPQPSADSYLHFIDAYIAYFLGKRKCLEPEGENDPARIYLLRRFRQDTTGKFAELRRQKELEEKHKQWKLAEAKHRRDQVEKEKRNHQELEEKQRIQQEIDEKEAFDTQAKQYKAETEVPKIISKETSWGERQKGRKKKDEEQTNKVRHQQEHGKQKGRHLNKELTGIKDKLNPYFSAFIIAGLLLFILWVNVMTTGIESAEGSHYFWGCFLITFTTNIWLSDRNNLSIGTYLRALLSAALSLILFIGMGIFIFQ